MIEGFPILAAMELSWFGVTLQVALLAVLVVLSGAFSGSETVLFSLSSAQLHHDAASHNPFRRLAARLMDRPKQVLMTVLLANTAVNVLLFANSYVLFHGLAKGYGAWITPVSGAASVLVVLVFGEVVPKVLAVTLADRLAPYAAAVVRAIGYVLVPVGRLLDFVVIEPLSRLIFGQLSTAAADEGNLTADELKTLLEMSRRRGLLNPVEDMFLREVIDLSSIRVRDIMVPRVEMVAFDVNGSPDELRELMRQTRLTKLPVYDGTIDRVVGLIYAKILFFETDGPLREFVTPVRFVPELITAEQLLRHFRATKSQISTVVDEFGGVAGLVTLEDVLEEIVGEIYDPDEPPPEAEIVERSSIEFDVSGRISVHDWAERFGLVSLPGRVATVGGLVTARLGRPARVGDQVRIGNLRFEVTATSHRRVERLRVTLSKPENTTPDEVDS